MRQIFLNRQQSIKVVNKIYFCIIFVVSTTANFNLEFKITVNSVSLLF